MRDKLIANKLLKEELVSVYLDTINTDFLNLNIKTNKSTWSPSTFIVEPLDTVSALIKYKNLSPAVLNMASHTKLGGGVANGAQAQEECLFRCSNLFQISPDLYPLNENDIIWSKNVQFIKDASYNKIKTIICDVITLPAVNLNTEMVSQIPDNYEELMCNKIKLMCNLAIRNNINTLILGAWGCGVFKNDPYYVAQLFKQVLSYYDFTVIFAIINDHNSVRNNYEIFKNYFT